MALAGWPFRANPQALWKEAQEEIQSGNLAAAETLLGAIRRLRAPTSLDRCLEAQIAVAGGRLDEALSALRQVPPDDPAAGQALLLTGRIERQRNLTRAAEAAFRKALACDPGLAEAHRELIYLLGLQLRRREVDAEFKALSRRTPLSHHELYTWGLSHFNFLQNVWTRDTADHLQAFLVADPEDRFSRLALASILLKSLEMEPMVERTLEPLPRSDPEATALRIALNLERGKIEDAVARLKDAPEGSPHLSRIRGQLALRRGDSAAAIRHFREALSDEPYDRVALSELGKALTLRGDRVEAERYLTQARSLDEVYDLLSRIRRPDRENEPADLIRLGRSCEAAGLLDESRGWYLLAISRNPLDSEAQQALLRLKTTSPP
jgi:tetratricopeptide (TPR) repeat protein